MGLLFLDKKLIGNKSALECNWELKQTVPTQFGFRDKNEADVGISIFKYHPSKSAFGNEICCGILHGKQQIHLLEVLGLTMFRNLWHLYKIILKNHNQELF